LQQVEQPNKTIWHTMLKTQMHSVWQGMPLTEQALILPFLSTLERLIPSIAECLQQRHDSGWHLQQQEGRVRGEVWLPHLGQAVTLAGRVDRVEQRAKQLCIVDIKTSNPKQLNKQAKNPETSPQLPLYQALLRAPNAELAYLAVHEDGVAWVPLAPWSQPTPENTEAQSWGELWMHRLQHEWGTFFDGHTLWQAQTNAKVCLQCDVRALCRPPLNTTIDEDETTEQEEPT
jgi:RecB family exonuclease